MPTRRDESQAKVYLEHLLETGWVALDTECTHLSPYQGGRVYSMAFCNHQGLTHSFRYRVNPFTREVVYTPADREALWSVLDYYRKENTPFVFHNSKFDIRMLHHSGLIEDVEFFPRNSEPRIHDTRILSHILRSNSKHGLKYLASEHLGINTEDEDELHAAIRTAREYGRKHDWKLGDATAHDGWMPLLSVKNDCSEKYNVRDAVRTSCLFRMFLQVMLQARKHGYSSTSTLLDLYQRERTLLDATYQMENTGITLRRNVLKSEINRVTTERDNRERSIQARAHTYLGKKPTTEKEMFNIRSPKQLRELLYDVLNLPTTVLTKSESNPQASTGAEALEILAEHLTLELKNIGGSNRDPQYVNGISNYLTLVEQILDYRKFEKQLGYYESYKDLAVETENILAPISVSKKRTPTKLVLYPNFNQCGTRTTRFSSDNPNNQNIPDDDQSSPRAVFGPEDGCYWIDCDFDNQEMRLFAWDSQEEELINAFLQGIPAHMVIAEFFYPELAAAGKLHKKCPEYKRIKNGNFAIIYGAGERRADTTYGIPGAYQKIRSRFRNLATYTDRLVAEATKNGYVDTMGGYRLFMDPGHEFAAVNYRIQGTAGELMKDAIINCNALFQTPDFQIPPQPGVYAKWSRPTAIMTIHDQLVFRIPNNLLLDSPKGYQLCHAIKDAMEAPARRFSIPTPITMSLVTKAWNEPTTIDLSKEGRIQLPAK